MRGRLQKRADDWRGGVVDRAYYNPFGSSIEGRPGKRVRPDEFANAVDLTYDRERGLARRRNGHTVGIHTTLAVASLLPYQDSAFSGHKLYVMDAAGGIRHFTYGGALSAVLVTLGAGDWLEGAQAVANGGQGPLYVQSDGGLGGVTSFAGAGPLTWTASSGTLPLGFFLLWAGNRMWVARLTNGAAVGLTAATGLMGLAWSDIGNPRAWPTANVNTFDPGDGFPITGIGRVGPYMLVFKANSTYLIYDLDTGANRQLSGEIGCIAHRTIKETPRGTMFLTRDRGLAICDGSSIRLIEDKLGIARLTRDYADSGTPSFYNAAYLDDRYYLAGLSLRTPDPEFLPLHIEYDCGDDSWWYHSPNPAVQCVWQGSGVTERWFSDDRNYTVSGVPFTRTIARALEKEGAYRTDYAGDAETFIDARLELAGEDFGTQRRKRLRSLTIEGRMKASTAVGADGVFTAADAIDIQSANLVAPNTPEIGRITIPRPSTVTPAQRIGVRIDAADSIGDPRKFELGAITVNADQLAR